jgi:signal peptidase I
MQDEAQKTVVSRGWKRRLRHVWRDWIQPLVVVVIVLGSFRSAIADWNDVPTGSMKPTILEGDRVFVNKLAYDLRVPFTSWRIRSWARPGRGDIVVLDSPYDGRRLVKRIVGLPGDQVEMREYRLIINGEPASYELVSPLEAGRARKVQETLDGHSHLILANPDKPAMPSFEPVVVPDDQYIVMGDNRDNSFDSRWFGYVSSDRIVGEVTRVVLSFDLDNHYLPRWERFLSPLE